MCGISKVFNFLTSYMTFQLTHIKTFYILLAIHIYTLNFHLTYRIKLNPINRV